MMVTAWHAVSQDLRRRDYGSYDDYVAHQQAKLSHMGADKLLAHEARYLEALLPRLMADALPRGTSVICLGARGGAEVRAFLSLGCMAVGCDLNPGGGNPYVLPGDFHALSYGDGTVSAVFTNALDHCYDLDRVLAEVHRVLVAGGRFLVEAVCGTEEGCQPGGYESLAWPTIQALIVHIESPGFTCQSRTPFVCPWRGEHLVFTRIKR
jgi:SAM-dependent methyltransferase